MQIDANKGKIVKLTKNKDQLFSEEEMSLPGLPSWPLGTQGALVIANGETVQITAGSTLDYSSIDIQLGGVLEIVASVSAAITYIGCSGNITINGELRARNYLGNTETVLGTIKGENIAFTLNQALGGNGGRTYVSGYPSTIVGPAPGLNGFGGGGAGGAANAYNFNPPSSTAWSFIGGGAGGVGGGSGSSGPRTGPNSANGGSGGSGNITLGNGANGNPAASPSSVDGANGGPGGSGGGSGGGGGARAGASGPNFTIAHMAASGGAGGGMKGKHGLPVYIYCLGSVTGLGVINLSGQNGFNGGQGANGVPGSVPASSSSGGGGSGGGGAGGSGGYLWVRYGTSFSVPYSVASGVGGGTGTNTISRPDGATSSDSQTAGSSGVTGGANIVQIL